MPVEHQRTDVIRIRSTAPRMWKGVDGVTRSPRDWVLTLRQRFARKPEPFIWVAN